MNTTTATIDTNKIDAGEWGNGYRTDTIDIDDAASELVHANATDWLEGVDTNGNDQGVLDWMADIVAESIRDAAAAGKTWASLDALADDMNATSIPADIPASVSVADDRRRTDRCDLRRAHLFEIAERHGSRASRSPDAASLGLSAPPGRPTERPACLDDPDWLHSGTLPELAETAGVSESTRCARRAVRE
ncbi:MAG: hypothetical protein R2754_00110 [Microthrixaceae bacterium]